MHEWQVTLGGVLLTVKDEDKGRARDMFSTTDDDLGQAAVRLNELAAEPVKGATEVAHRYTVPLGSGAINGKGELCFTAHFTPLPPDRYAMGEAYKTWTGSRSMR